MRRALRSFGPIVGLWCLLSTGLMIVTTRVADWAYAGG